MTSIEIEARTTEIRAQLNSAPNGVRKRGQGYRSEARTMAIEHARRLMKSGVPLVHAAKSFGISSKTLGVWLRMTPDTEARGAFAHVHVRQTVSDQKANLHFVLPSGAYISGLDVTSAAALVRALG